MKFRKKPVVIEAVQWTGDNYTSDVRLFAGTYAHINEAGSLIVQTLENRLLKADVGDWIIRGVKGEFYPCKPDIFEATYEAVDAGVPV